MQLESDTANSICLDNLYFCATVSLIERAKRACSFGTLGQLEAGKLP